jgi:hypothetical protein
MRRTLLLLSLLGCATEPTQDTPHSPPAEYRAWWQEMEQCAKRSGDFERVQWFLFDSEAHAGYYVDGKIWLHRRYQMHRGTVTHEELHALGVKGHKGPEWQACKVAMPR